MAEAVADVIAATPYFKDGFSFQTGVGGPSLAANQFIEKHMEERGIKMGFSLGGITGLVCNLQKKGLIKKIVDVPVSYTHLSYARPSSRILTS